jgi:hypothetical protein
MASIANNTKASLLQEEDEISDAKRNSTGKTFDIKQH